MPPSLARFLTTVGEEAIACRDVGLRDADDGEIWRFAIAGGWCIVTKDEDFAVRHMTESGGLQRAKSRATNTRPTLNSRRAGHRKVLCPAVFLGRADQAERVAKGCPEVLAGAGAGVG